MWMLAAFSRKLLRCPATVCTAPSQKRKVPQPRAVRRQQGLSQPRRPSARRDELVSSCNGVTDTRSSAACRLCRWRVTGRGDSSAPPPAGLGLSPCAMSGSRRNGRLNQVFVTSVQEETPAPKTIPPPPHPHRTPCNKITCSPVERIAYKLIPGSCPTLVRADSVARGEVFLSSSRCRTPDTTKQKCAVLQTSIENAPCTLASALRAHHLR